MARRGSQQRARGVYKSRSVSALLLILGLIIWPHEFAKAADLGCDCCGYMHEAEPELSLRDSANSWPHGCAAFAAERDGLENDRQRYN
jgi:hypothetical protein